VACIEVEDNIFPDDRPMARIVVGILADLERLLGR
jgi:hypothetical protein